MACPPGRIPQRLCDLETALRAVLENEGHPPIIVTFTNAVNSFDPVTQTLNIQITESTANSTDTVVFADDAARAAATPANLRQIGVQTTDATNGNGSLWVPTGLAAGNWALKVARMAAQNPSTVAITGGSIVGIADLLLADGGTGASTAAGARTNLNLATLTSTASALDWALSDNYAESITANTTFTFVNDINGKALVLALIMTGAFTVAFPAAVQWNSPGTAPTPSTTGTDVYEFVRVGGVVYGNRRNTNAS